MQEEIRKIDWFVLHFDQLSNKQLYDLLRLRSEVFVVEQQCIFLDMDNLDQQCYHVLGYWGDMLAGTTRLVPKGLAYTEYPSIGRVVTSPALRGNGIGRQLMEFSILETTKLFGNSAIKIGAQLYLEKFYQSLGFNRSGSVYLEDGIEHIPMILD